MSVLERDSVRGPEVVLFAKGGSDDNGEGRWVTIDGTHVHIDKSGTIDKGPSGMTGEKPSELGDHNSHSHDEATGARKPADDHSDQHSHPDGEHEHSHPSRAHTHTHDNGEAHSHEGGATPHAHPEKQAEHDEEQHKPEAAPATEPPAQTEAPSATPATPEARHAAAREAIQQHTQPVEAHGFQNGGHGYMDAEGQIHQAEHQLAMRELAGEALTKAGKPTTKGEAVCAGSRRMGVGLQANLDPETRDKHPEQAYCATCGSLWYTNNEKNAPGGYLRRHAYGEMKPGQELSAATGIHAIHLDGNILRVEAAQPLTETQQASINAMVASRAALGQPITVRLEGQDRPLSGIGNPYLPKQMRWFEDTAGHTQMTNEALAGHFEQLDRKSQELERQIDAVAQDQQDAKQSGYVIRQHTEWERGLSDTVLAKIARAAGQNPGVDAWADKAELYVMPNGQVSGELDMALQNAGYETLSEARDASRHDTRRTSELGKQLTNLRKERVQIERAMDALAKGEEAETAPVYWQHENTTSSDTELPFDYAPAAVAVPAGAAEEPARGDAGAPRAHPEPARAEPHPIPGVRPADEGARPGDADPSDGAPRAGVLSPESAAADPAEANRMAWQSARAAFQEHQAALPRPGDYPQTEAGRAQFESALATHKERYGVLLDQYLEAGRKPMGSAPRPEATPAPTTATAAPPSTAAPAAAAPATPKSWLEEHGVRPSPAFERAFNEDTLHQFAARGLTPPEASKMKVEATRKVQEFARKAHLKMALTPTALDGILITGDFRNTHQTGTSMVGGNSGSVLEQRQAELHGEQPPEHRPKYGFLELPNERNYNVDQYGPIHAVFKPQTKERATMTVGDSLMGGTAHRPMPVTNPDWQTMGALDVARHFGKPETPMRDVGDWEYAEAQIHGPLSLADVDHFRIHPDAVSPTDDYDQLGPAEVKRLTKMLNDEGHKVVVGEGRNAKTYSPKRPYTPKTPPATAAAPAPTAEPTAAPAKPSKAEAAGAHIRKYYPTVSPSDVAQDDGTRGLFLHPSGELSQLRQGIEHPDAAWGALKGSGIRTNDQERHELKLSRETGIHRARSAGNGLILDTAGPITDQQFGTVANWMQARKERSKDVAPMVMWTHSDNLTSDQGEYQGQFNTIGELRRAHDKKFPGSEPKAEAAPTAKPAAPPADQALEAIHAEAPQTKPMTGEEFADAADQGAAFLHPNGQYHTFHAYAKAPGYDASAHANDIAGGWLEHEHLARAAIEKVGLHEADGGVGQPGEGAIQALSRKTGLHRVMATGQDLNLEAHSPMTSAQMRAVAAWLKAKKDQGAREPRVAAELGSGHFGFYHSIGELRRAHEEHLGSVKFRDYAHGTTHVLLRGHIARRMQALGSAIPEEHLHEYGREQEPHVTIKYGLTQTDDDTHDAIRQIAQDHEPFTVRMGKTSLFPADETGKDFDVVKVDVDSPELHALHHAIGAAVPTEDAHPDYHPHATIAYVKAGEGHRYAGMDALDGEEQRVDRFMMSDTDGRTHTYRLGAKQQQQQRGALMPALAAKFRTWTKEAREKLDRSNFGDPDKRLFPIADQSDVDDAASLIGHADNPEAVKKRIIAICKRLHLNPPKAWEAQMSAGFSEEGTDSAAFAADLRDAASDGEYVLRTGKIFEAGEYPQRQFSLSPEEMLAAVEAFQPVELDLEHEHTVLDGKLGELRDVRLSDDGWSLEGTVALPRWLHDTLPPGPVKVSTTWDRPTKRITGMALTRNPVVKDAALFSAYAEFATKHHTYSGQRAIQEAHDVAARAGAVCKASERAEMASRHEASAIQQIHDVATEHGATCERMTERGAGALFNDPAGSSARPSFPATQGKKGPVMGLKDLLAQAFAGKSDEEIADALGFSIGEAPSADAVQLSVTKLELEREQAARRAAEAEAARLRSEHIHNDAVRFADKYVEEERAFPNERDQVIALYVQAATDDGANGVVKFSDTGVTTTRVQMLTSAMDARPPHQLTQEMLAPEIKFAVQARQSPRDPNAPLTGDRRKELLKAGGYEVEVRGN